MDFVVGQIHASAALPPGTHWIGAQGRDLRFQRTENFLPLWGIEPRLSSSYLSQYTDRAILRVPTKKRGTAKGEYGRKLRGLTVKLQAAKKLTLR